jgi:hypothetical protein
VPAGPDLAEGLLVVLRWLHAAASIVFLGWSAVLWLDGPPRGDPSAARQRFKEITELTLLVFLATGAVLTFDRLSRGAGGLYAAVLALKVACAVVTYQFAFRWPGRPASWRTGRSNTADLRRGDGVSGGGAQGGFRKWRQ